MRLEEALEVAGRAMIVSDHTAKVFDADLS